MCVPQTQTFGIRPLFPPNEASARREPAADDGASSSSGAADLIQVMISYGSDDREIGHALLEVGPAQRCIRSHAGNLLARAIARSRARRLDRRAVRVGMREGPRRTRHHSR